MEIIAWNEEELSQAPQDDEFFVKKLVNYFGTIAQILKAKHNWNVSKLYEQLGKTRKFKTEAASSEDTVTLSGTEVKKILMANKKKLANILEISLKRVLEFLANQLNNLEKMSINTILILVTKLAKFLKACENNNLVTSPMVNGTNTFLGTLVKQLGQIDDERFNQQGFRYQIQAAAISSFKRIQFGNKFIITRLSTEFKSLSKIETSYNASTLESILLYLGILKNLLEYNVDDISFFKSKKALKTNSEISKEIYASLLVLRKTTPNYVVTPINKCLNLLF